ncbi:tRNA lysidine(34) synthetase TilS [Sulfitobacter donghicola]|uniref:tRNA(Ile)-lysidine synthase n=1 Tax=Sulfitobacter donghicola DSW-25 = KCTC 12864 = JCM 14565 TaxID=1300350 RepID=A0A073ID06_9RHOB|nr:tRNA lysidine(34) synthetase TilS [Sulfitobacter donghicola]KEJ88233.1 hypothetical protein DSW25_16290 [Sulfitobacter donghicola DSW-25 = KCTC 12864 = JCM 14565]KIN68827.1 tRNA(Ile)-lysidine synthase [Sulfitobacter donghicola DSW-25 = KCTC 12864 = JCM 14565]
MQLDQSWVMQQGADAMLLHAIDVAFGSELPKRVGIAVSGGGDSVALLHLFARWSEQTGHPIAAVTVDHGLRAESRAEAEGVAALCTQLGVSHDIFTWSGPNSGGNVSAAARDARYDLMAKWAKTAKVGGIALGHTMDDTAENMLIRLGRSAGLDGLAQMQTLFRRNGILWSRPLWQQHRSTLRDYLKRQQIEWVDDPTNDDPHYMRTKARRLLPSLKELGIDADSLHHSAFALRQSQEALAHYTRQEARSHVTQEGGDLLLSADFTREVPADIERRLTAAALQWVGSLPYPPRKVFAGFLGRELEAQNRLNLAGCLVQRGKGHIRITREFNAVKDTVTKTNEIWDTRWRLVGPHDDSLEVRALGEGVLALPDWRAIGVPRHSLMSSPAVWKGENLVAAPLAGYNLDWSAQIVADFTSFLLLH